MGYGNESLNKLSVRDCFTHRYVRLEKKADGRKHPVRVGCRTPSPTDYCSRCKKRRYELEGSVFVVEAV